MVDRLARELGDRLTVDWRAFELRPEPVPTLPPDGEYLRRVWGSSVYPMAEARGMTMRRPPVQPRTRLAHQAAEHARARGRFDAYRRRLFRAFFEEAQDLGRPEVLAGLAAEEGLDGDELLAALAAETHLARVLEQEKEAALLGLRGVPAILIGERPETGRIVIGALPYDDVRRAVDEVLAGRQHRAGERSGTPVS